MGANNLQRFGSFQTTRWSLVQDAAAADTRTRREAIGELICRYYPALRAYLVFQGRFSEDVADDLLQGFVADKILERQLLSTADASRGTFRSLLLTSLKNYLVDQLRRRKLTQSNANAAASPACLGCYAAGDECPDPFDVLWARQVLSQTLTRMRSHFRERHREHIWRIFEARVLRPELSGDSPVSYKDLAVRFGFTSPEQAANAQVSALRGFRRMLRLVVAEYAIGDDEVDDEIAHFKRVLSAAGPLTANLYQRDEPVGGQWEQSLANALDDATAEALSHILDAEASSLTGWSTQDKQDALRHVMSQSLGEFIPGPASDCRLGDLFQSRSPALDVLQAVKQHARKWMLRSESRMLREIHHCLYLASIAAALVEHQTRISSLSDAELYNALDFALQQPWLDAQLRRVLDQAATQIRSSSSFQKSIEPHGRSISTQTE